MVTFNYNERMSSDICPCCGSVLWEELGFWSENEYLIWNLYYYPKWYGWNMGLSHYRRP